jgi:four helix bundle protein
MQDDRKQILRNRTKAFAASVIRFYMHLDQRKEELRTLGRQVLRSATSVAANYREASRARSDQEFIAKIDLCSQEADETQLWLELLGEECGISKNETDPIWNEADELIRIFVTMSKNTKKRA